MDDSAQVLLATEAGGAAPYVHDKPPLLPSQGKPPSDVDQASRSSLVLAADSSLVPVARPTSNGWTTRFAGWIRILTLEQIADMSASFATWKAAEMEWLKSLAKRTLLLFEKSVV